MLLITEYIAKVRERIDAERAALGRGAAANFEEYKRRVGIVAGLEAAITILEDILKVKPKEERI